MDIAKETIVPAAPKYIFKIPPELVKALWISALTYLMTFLANDDLETAGDWKRIAMAFGVGLVQALGPVVVAWLGPGYISTKG